MTIVMNDAINSYIYVYPYLNKFQDTSIIIKLNELKHYEAHDVEKCISNVFDNTLNLIRVTILYKIL